MAEDLRELTVVALLSDIPEHKLVRGQVGTIVHASDGANVLVEFSDDQGRAYAILPCAGANLLVLHHVPQAA